MRNGDFPQNYQEKCNYENQWLEDWALVLEQKTILERLGGVHHRKLKLAGAWKGAKELGVSKTPP